MQLAVFSGRNLPERIMAYAQERPEATPIQAQDHLSFGDWATVSRALSRLARAERLMRICRGIYMRPIQTRFGLRAPRQPRTLTSYRAGPGIPEEGGGERIRPLLRHTGDQQLRYHIQSDII